MAATSSMLPLGTELPSFTLPDVASGRQVSSSDLMGHDASVVAFICNHCPYVRHIIPGLTDLAAWCRERGVPVVAISSNDATAYPEDGPERMAAEARRWSVSIPYLFDESQDVARAFQAACTPELYVFDREGRLRYRGQFDDSRPNNAKPVTGADVRAAVEALLRGEAPSELQTPSVGCSIKWKPKNAP